MTDDQTVDPEIREAVLANADSFDRIYQDVEKIESQARKDIDALSEKIAIEETNPQKAQERFQKESAIILAHARVALKEVENKASANS